jgi:hypothetical protein
MKKLKKLSINKMNEFPIIEETEQKIMKGGFDPKAAWQYIWQQEVGNTINDFEAWYQGARDKVENFMDNAIPVAINGAETAAQWILNSWGGGGSVFGAPFLYIDSPVLNDYFMSGTADSFGRIY